MESFCGENCYCSRSHYFLENRYGSGNLIGVTGFGYEETTQGFPDKGLVAADKAYKAAEDALVSRVLELGWVKQKLVKQNYVISKY